MRKCTPNGDNWRALDPDDIMCHVCYSDRQCPSANIDCMNAKAELPSFDCGGPALIDLNDKESVWEALDARLKGHFDP